MSINALEYSYQTRRLALGIEFSDAPRDSELVYPVRAEIERESPHRSPAPARKYDFTQLGTQAPYGLLRDRGGRYSLSYYPGIREQVDVRIYDYDRYYIPRRLRIPLMTLEDVLTIETDEDSDYFSGRVRNVAMFPGAAYHSHPQVTGLRGRVIRDDEAMRWAYIEARLPGSSTVIARTRGDDRGEFFLILPPHASTASDLNATIDIEVSVAGPATTPTPSPLSLATDDEFWDLPFEVVPPIGAADDVSNGEAFPSGYVTALSAVRTITFQVGRLLTGRDVADFEFVVP